MSPVVTPQDFPPNKGEGPAPVVSGVTHRPSPLRKRLFGEVVTEDARSVGEYIFWDVALPAIKNLVSELVSTGVDRLLFGEARSSARRTSIHSRSARTYTNYSSIASQSRPTSPSRQQRASRPDIGEIVLQTRSDAEAVTIELDRRVQDYGTATVGDLYSLVGVSSSPIDEKWGWRELPHVNVRRVRDGYILELPETQPLN